MGRGVPGGAGGIRALVELIDEHGLALETDLIRSGLRLRWLGSEALTWRDLLALVAHTRPDSALAASLGPDHLWGLTEQLLAAGVDMLRILAWQNTEDASRPWTAPEPTARMGSSPAASPSDRVTASPLAYVMSASWTGEISTGSA